MNFNLLSRLLPVSVIWVVLFTFLFNPTAQAKTAIAKVISVKGGVYALLGEQKRKLKRRSKTFKEETIVTKKNANVQLRFTDGALIALNEDAQLKVSEYDFNDKESDKVTFDLLEGQLRTITGKIGKKNKKNYQMKTPVATIGIRGTHYVLNYCSSNCVKKHQGQVKKGLYGGVYQGSIWTRNKTGDKDFNKDGYFYVQSEDAKPQVLLHVPETLNEIVQKGKGTEEKKEDDNAAIAGVAGDDSVLEDSGPDEYLDVGSELLGGTTESPVTQVESTTQTIVDATTNLHSNNVTNYQTAPMGNYGGIAMNFVNSLGSLDSFAELVESGVDGTISLGEIVPGPANLIVRVQDDKNPCPPCIAKIEDGFLLDGGGDTLGVNWGRWAGKISVQDQYGAHSIENGNMHYIYVGNPTTAIPASGNFVFNYVGGTTPTSNTGSSGSILPGTLLNVDFTTSAISAVINVGIDGKIMNATGASTFSGTGESVIMLSGTCTGCAGNTLTGGELQTIFIGPGASGAAGPFSIISSDGGVSGVLFFKQ